MGTWATAIPSITLSCWQLRPMRWSFPAMVIATSVDHS